MAAACSVLHALRLARRFDKQRCETSDDSVADLIDRSIRAHAYLHSGGTAGWLTKVGADFNQARVMRFDERINTLILNHGGSGAASVLDCIRLAYCAGRVLCAGRGRTSRVSQAVAAERGTQRAARRAGRFEGAAVTGLYPWALRARSRLARHARTPA